MFKNLNPFSIGISGRQSELIELALTFGFRSLEVSMDDLLKKAQKQNAEHAVRFLTSAQLKLGTFELPIDWRGDEQAYLANLEGVDEIAAIAAAAGGTACHTAIESGSDVFPYHDNFELHRKRLAEIADRLGQHGLRLGISLQPLPAQRSGKEFQFIFETDALITLLKSVPSENVGLYLDTWSWHFGGGTVEQLQTLEGRQVVGLTIADAPVDALSDTVDDSQRLIPSEAGAVDVAGLIRQVHLLGFRGPVSLSPSGDSFAGLTREGIVQKCSQVLDRLLKDASAATSQAVPALSSQTIEA